MAANTKKGTNDAPQERRYFPRLSASVEVEYSILERQKKALTKNIGAGGFCLIVYEKIEPGAILGLKIRLPDTNYVISAEGIVIWSSHFTVGTENRGCYDLGIEFMEIEEADRQKISQHIFKLSK